MKHTRRIFVKIALSALISAVLPPPLAAQHVSSRVIVRVTNIRNTAGKVVIGIWNSKDGFPKEGSKAFRRATVDIVNGAATTTFADIPYGRYAVALYHDENSNGKMDTRFLGIPLEGVGSSNNVQPKFSAPHFDECSVEVTTPEKIIPIRMLY